MTTNTLLSSAGTAGDVWGQLELDASDTPSTEDNKAPMLITLTSLPSNNRFTIGRLAGNDCVLENPCISGMHCIFSYVMSSSFTSQDGTHNTASPVTPQRKVSLVDKSTNGVYVNGTQIGKNNTTNLQDKDIIELVHVSHRKNNKYRIQYILRIFQPQSPAQQIAPSAPAAAATGRSSAVPFDPMYKPTPPAPLSQMGPNTQVIPLNRVDGGMRFPIIAPPQEPKNAFIDALLPLTKAPSATPPPTPSLEAPPVKALIASEAKEPSPSIIETNAVVPQANLIDIDATSSSIAVVISDETMASQLPGDAANSVSSAASHAAALLEFIGEKQATADQLLSAKTSQTQNHTANPSTKPLPRVMSDTQAQSQMVQLTAPPAHDKKAKVDEVYTLLTDKPLGSGAFATVYKATPKAQMGAGGTPYPYYAIKVLDKTRLMGLSLKDEDAQYFASLANKGSKQHGGNGSTKPSASPRRFAFGADEAKVDAETANADILRQLMDIDSDGSEDGGISEEETKDVVVAQRELRTSPATPTIGHKRTRSSQATSQQGATIRRNRAKAAELEKKHQELLSRLTEDTRHRYERYLKEKLRWRREVMILRSITHPNVIRTFDVFDTDTSLSLVLELAEGGNLYSLITEGSLPELIAKVIVYQLLTGVQYLHMHGVVHRDIKLENLLIGRPFTVDSFVAASRQVESSKAQVPNTTNGGANGFFDNKQGIGGSHFHVPRSIYDITRLPSRDMWPEVKITDFGLSRMLGEETTTMSTMCGTPIYAAPEVTIVKLREGTQSGYTAAVDIYSIGVVAFALLTARPPFPHPKDNYGRDIKSRIMYDKPLSWVRKSSHNNVPPVTANGMEVVKQMLALRPVDRITADEALGHPWFAEVRHALGIE